MQTVSRRGASIARNPLSCLLSVPGQTDLLSPSLFPNYILRTHDSHSCTGFTIILTTYVSTNVNTSMIVPPPM